MAVTQSQSVTNVNFSLYSPVKPSASDSATLETSANHSTPPRHRPPRPPNKYASPGEVSANHLSPVQRHPTNQNYLSSPGKDSVISHSTEKDFEEASIETAAMMRLKQFQEYMNKYGL